MRKIIVGAVAALMAISLAPSSFAAVNEAVVQGTIGMKWQVTSSGSVTAADASFKLSDENVCPGSGPYSLKMEHNNNVSGTIAIKIPVTLTANSTYRITFKSTEGMGNNTLRQKVILGQSDKGWASGCRMFSSNKNVTTVNLEDGWMQHTFDYTAPAGALWLSLGTEQKGVDRYFDDFEISLVTTDDEGSEVLTPLEIPNGDFNFKDPSVKNISAYRNVISWEETESYDTLNLYEKNTSGEFVKVTEAEYPATECTVNLPAEPKTYYITTVTDGVETIDVPVTVFPDKQISAITLKNASDETIESLESGTLTAAISIENNSVEEGIDAQLITVLYKDDVVVSASATAAQTIAANGATVDPTVLSLPVTVDLTDEGVYRLEVYVWDSFAAMNVVANTLVVNEPAE